jgi:hypothetical protein
MVLTVRGGEEVASEVRVGDEVCATMAEYVGVAPPGHGAPCACDDAGKGFVLRTLLVLPWLDSGHVLPAASVNETKSLFIYFHDDFGVFKLWRDWVPRRTPAAAGEKVKPPSLVSDD